MKINQPLLLFLFLCLNFYTIAQENEPIDGCNACQPLGFNIIGNGDFEMGNIGFNSDLTYDPANGCELDSYSFFDSTTSNCQGNDLADHTSGTGNYMSVNLGLVDDEGASNNGITIWSKDTLLLKNQQYSFSFWVYSESIFNGNEPTLEVSIDGITIGETTSLNDSPLNNGGWQEFCFNYISEFESIQTIAIIASYPVGSEAENTAFLLDDISLNPLYPDAISCELIVQYEPGTSQERIDSIRSRFDITVQDSCVCGEIDLWLINQFPMVVNGDTIIDIEKLKLSSRDTADVQDVDYNYTTQNHASRIAQAATKPSTVYDNNNFAPNSDDSCAIVVAIIDTGIDDSHDFFNDPQYYPNSLWSFSAPCPADGNNGYNFYDNDNNPYDNGNNGHGTHVSGIVAQQFNDNFSGNNWTLELMPVKAQNADGKGTLFKIICSTLFAIDNGADVINMSFGYRGDSTAILYNAIEKGLFDNEIIVVASAGNDAKNNDLYGHYPSNLSNENLIAVAADTLGENSMRDFARYSCFGANSVDIAGFGSIESCIPVNVDTMDEMQDGFTFLQGTSMAAPQIAAAAAIGKAYMNSAEDIKQKILQAGNAMNISADTVSMTNLSFDMTTFTQNLSSENSCSVALYDNPTVNHLVTISPNPVKDLLQIKYEGTETIQSITLYDIQGKKLTNPKFGNDHQILVSRLPKGVYILEVNLGKYKARKKFIKM
jgi:subtilisin family serine protease